MAGRTSWLPRDAAHHDREQVVELGEEFGPVGPYIDTLLRDLAQQQRSDGHVLTGFRSLARKAFVDPGTVRQVISYGAEIGLFDDLVFHEDGRRFELWCSGWEADARRGTEAVRKADQRAAKAEAEQTRPTGEGLVPFERDKSRCVPLTRPDQTTTETPNPNVEPADSTIARELFEHWREVCHHPQAKPTQERLRAIRARLKEGYTVDQITAAIGGAAVAAFVDDRGKRHDDLTLICRNGSKLEDFIARGQAKPPAQRGTVDAQFDQLRANEAEILRRQGEAA